MTPPDNAAACVGGGWPRLGSLTAARSRARKQSGARILLSFCAAPCLTRGVSDVNLGIWSKLTRVVTGLLFVAGLLALAVWYLPLIRQNERMRKEVLRLEAQIALQEAAGRELKTSIDALRNDPKSVERLAREKLGYAKQGETVIRFEEPATNRTALN